jgi:hypothetical protein
LVFLVAVLGFLTWLQEGYGSDPEVVYQHMPDVNSDNFLAGT